MDDTGFLAQQKAIEEPAIPPVVPGGFQADLISQAGRPEWKDKRIPTEKRLDDFLQFHATNQPEGGPDEKRVFGRAYNYSAETEQKAEADVLAKAKDLFPGVSPDGIKQQFQLERARARQAGQGEDTLEYLARSVMPLRSIGNANRTDQYRRAIEAHNAGTATPDQHEIIARYERLNKIEADEDTFDSTKRAVLGVPGMLAEGYAGGMAVKGLGLLRPGLAAGAGRLGVQTAAMPSMYLEQGAQNQLANPKDNAVQSYAPAYGIGLVQTAVLGRMAGRAEGVKTLAGRLGARTGLGMAEMQGADVALSAVDHAVKEATDKTLGLDTKFGLLGSFVREDDDRWKHAIAQTATFGAFATLHGHPAEPIRETFKAAVDAGVKPADLVAAVKPIEEHLARNTVPDTAAVQTIVEAAPKEARPYVEAVVKAMNPTGRPKTPEEAEARIRAARPDLAEPIVQQPPEPRSPVKPTSEPTAPQVELNRPEPEPPADPRVALAEVTKLRDASDGRLAEAERAAKAAGERAGLLGAGPKAKQDHAEALVELRTARRERKDIQKQLDGLRDAVMRLPAPPEKAPEAPQAAAESPPPVPAAEPEIVKPATPGAESGQARPLSRRERIGQMLSRAATLPERDLLAGKLHDAVIRDAGLAGKLNEAQSSDIRATLEYPSEQAGKGLRLVVEHLPGQNALHINFEYASRNGGLTARTKGMPSATGLTLMRDLGKIAERAKAAGMAIHFKAEQGRADLYDRQLKKVGYTQASVKEGGPEGLGLKEYVYKPAPVDKVEALRGRLGARAAKPVAEPGFVPEAAGLEVKAKVPVIEKPEPPPPREGDLLAMAERSPLISKDEFAALNTLAEMASRPAGVKLGVSHETVIKRADRAIERLKEIYPEFREFENADAFVKDLAAKNEADRIQLLKDNGVDAAHVAPEEMHAIEPASPAGKTLLAEIDRHKDVEAKLEALVNQLVKEKERDPNSPKVADLEARGKQLVASLAGRGAGEPAGAPVEAQAPAQGPARKPPAPAAPEPVAAALLEARLAEALRRVKADPFAVSHADAKALGDQVAALPKAEAVALAEKVSGLKLKRNDKPGQVVTAELTATRRGLETQEVHFDRIEEPSKYDALNWTPPHLELNRGEPAKNPTVGHDTTIATPGGAVPARYEVRELADVRASHQALSLLGGIRTRPPEEYPAGLQPRDYSKIAGEKEKVQRFAKEMIPSYYISNHPDATSGPPAITADGTVVNGNGRQMSLERATHLGTFGKYKAELVKQAQAFGIDPAAVEKMKHPALYRVVDMDPKGPEALKFARAGNVAPTQAQSPVRTAAALSSLIDQGVIDSLRLEGDTTFAEAVSDPVKGRAFRQELAQALPPSEKSRYLTEDNALTETGKEFVRDMLLTKILPVELVERMGESMKQVKRTIEGAIPQLIKLRRDFPASDPTPAIVEALDVWSRNDHIRKVADADNLLDQGSLFDFNSKAVPISPNGRMMLDFLLQDGMKPLVFRKKLVGLVTDLEHTTKGLFAEPVADLAEAAANVLGVKKREGATFAKPRADERPGFGRPLSPEERRAGVVGGGSGEGDGPPQRQTALANAKVDEERAYNKLPPLMAAARRVNEKVWDEAMAKLDADPGLSARLVDELAAKTRATTVDENALLLHRKIALNNEYMRTLHKAVEASFGPKKDLALADRLTEQADALLGQIDKLDKVTRETGTEWGRAGQFRRQLAKEDYSLGLMLTRARQAKGKPLTAGEMDAIKKQHEEITKADAALDEPVKPAGQPGDLTDAKVRAKRARKAYDETLAAFKRANRPIHVKILHGGLETFNAVRSLITAFDLSAVFRQGGLLTFAHPFKATRAFADSLKAFGNAHHFERSQQELADRPNAQLYHDAGLYLAEHDGGPTGQEEAFLGRWVGKIPGLAASARAYTSFLNRMRADVFDSMTASMARDGKPDLAEARAIANFVNVSTGRGKLPGRLDQAAGTLAQVFFSPRYVASRFQILAGQPFYSGTARSRGKVAVEFARSLAGIGVFYAVMKAFNDDAEVTFDPRSADFGKVKMGPARIDPLTGLSQVAVFGTRLVSGEFKSSQSGKITPLRGPDVPFGGQTVMDVISRFLRGKLAPVPGLTVDVATGQNAVGETETWGKAAGQVTVPISVRDVYEAMTEQGMPRGFALSLLAILGMGTQVYDPKVKTTALQKKKAAEENPPILPVFPRSQLTPVKKLGGR